MPPAVFFKFVVGMVVALLLHRMKNYAAVFTALVLLPWIVPEVVRSITWKGILDPIYGMVNPILKDLGLINESIPFLGDPNLALPLVIMVNLWSELTGASLLMAIPVFFIYALGQRFMVAGLTAGAVKGGG